MSAAAALGRRIARSRVAYLFLLPQVVGFAIFAVYPIVETVRLSLTNWSGLGRATFVGAANYARLWNDPILWRSFWNTVLYAFYYVVPCLIVSLGIALLLNLRIRGMPWFRGVYYIPVVTSFVVAAFIWNWLFDFNVGLFNYYLARLGLPPFPWLLSPRMALPSLALMSVWKNAGYTVLIYLAALQNIPDEYVESARIDGASAWQAIRHITIPLLQHTTVLVVVMLTIWSFQMFVQPYIMTQGGPAYATTSLVYYLYHQGFVNFQMGYASALAVVLTGLVLSVSLVQNRLLNRTALEV
jgi:ABC-type sugar transport system permease subunit